ncbi:hypothetical protein IWZ01DRAFT_538254 [Phyllosticta capitalensis]
MDTSSLKVERGSVIVDSPSPPKSRISAHVYDDSIGSPDIVIGRILWLPSIAELPKNAVQQAHPKAEAAADDVYNHPVVVCSRPSRDRVQFFIITSFNSRSLEQRFGPTPFTRPEQERIQGYLPISPSQPHPRLQMWENGLRTPVILLEGDKKMLRNSFINTSTVYAINSMSLRPYGSHFNRRRPEHFIEEGSVKVMLDWSKMVAHYSPGPQYRLRQPKAVKPRLQERPSTEGETGERPETPQVPVEAGTKCPFLMFLKVLAEAPRTAFHELRSGSIPLGLALGIVAIVLGVSKILSMGLHTILKYGYWGIRRAILAMWG